MGGWEDERMEGWKDGKQVKGSRLEGVCGVCGGEWVVFFVSLCEERRIATPLCAQKSFLQTAAKILKFRVGVISSFHRLQISGQDLGLSLPFSHKWGNSLSEESSVGGLSFFDVFVRWQLVSHFAMALVP